MPREPRNQNNGPVKGTKKETPAPLSGKGKKKGMDDLTKLLIAGGGLVAIGFAALMLTEPAEVEVKIEPRKKVTPVAHKMAPVATKMPVYEQDIEGLDGPDPFGDSGAFDQADDAGLDDVGFAQTESRQAYPSGRVAQETKKQTPVVTQRIQRPVATPSRPKPVVKTAPKPVETVKVYASKSTGSDENPFMPKYLEKTLAKMTDTIVAERLKEIEEKERKSGKKGRVTLDKERDKDETDAFFYYEKVPNNIYVKEYTIDRSGTIVLRTEDGTFKSGDDFYGGKITNISDDRIFVTRDENKRLSKKGEKPVRYKEEKKRYKVYYSIAFDGEDIIKKEVAESSATLPTDDPFGLN